MKRVFILLFWLAFFAFFFLLTVPKLLEFTNQGFPEYMGATWMEKRLWFLLHMSFGTVVYISGLIQFTPWIRKNYLSFHRMLGKVYIIASLVCITTLYIIVPGGQCAPCRISNFMVTSLWLVFVLLAYYFIRQRRIVLHQRLMISSYICAAYFVTVRIVDRYAMGIFRDVFPDESSALLASDIFVWFVPLVIFWGYWLIKDKRAGSIIKASTVQ